MTDIASSSSSEDIAYHFASFATNIPSGFGTPGNPILLVSLRNPSVAKVYAAGEFVRRGAEISRIKIHGIVRLLSLSSAGLQVEPCLVIILRLCRMIARSQTKLHLRFGKSLSREYIMCEIGSKRREQRAMKKISWLLQQQRNVIAELSIGSHIVRNLYRCSEDQHHVGSEPC